MLKRLAGLIVASCSMLLADLPAAAQQGNQTSRYPTDDQWATSTVGQQHIAAARAAATPGLMNEFERTCTPLGPQRP